MLAGLCHAYHSVGVAGICLLLCIITGTACKSKYLHLKCGNILFAGCGGDGRLQRSEVRDRFAVGFDVFVRKLKFTLGLMKALVVLLCVRRGVYDGIQRDRDGLRRIFVVVVACKLRCVIFDTVCVGEDKVRALLVVFRFLTVFEVLLVYLKLSYGVSECRVNDGGKTLLLPVEIGSAVLGYIETVYGFGYGIDTLCLLWTFEEIRYVFKRFVVLGEVNCSLV